MRLTDFNYSLPETLIAEHPLKRRDEARLMVIDRKAGAISHDVFANLGAYLPKRSCLVLNDSKVVPARLFGKKKRNGAGVEVFLLKALDDGYSYEALLRPLKRVKESDEIVFNGSRLTARLIDRGKGIVRFNRKDVTKYLSRIGHIPLPPYIRRPDSPADKKDYQTVYAKRAGSVASPTAGLHFTKALLNRLKKDDHAIEKVTLHINYGTFKPVEEDDVTKHKMHMEEYAVSTAVFNRIKKAKDNKRSIVAVGTTSCRVMETIAKNKKLTGRTNIFIYPGYRFKMTDALITNFHLPLSTLLMLVYAFGGSDVMRRAYREAIKRKYRFYSYGDAMIII